MQFLLTSAGIMNASIRDALVGLLGKPIAESSALAIPTSSYPLRRGPELAWNFIAGQEPRSPMIELGWASVGNFELSALPTLGEARWLPAVRDADVLLVNGGDPLYLAYWLRQSGLADVLPSLPAVYVGLSAGSIVLGPDIDAAFVGWAAPTGGDEPLGLVDFTIFPHLDHPDLPENTMADAERWATRLLAPGYAIDDQTAIRVVDGAVDVISEGHWRRFEP